MLAEHLEGLGLREGTCHLGPSVCTDRLRDGIMNELLE